MKINNINAVLVILIILISYENCFLISVIMAIYNTGRYLDDSINSLINQTINFEKKIQVILVNDGSTDDSEMICLKYSNIYQNNIIYIQSEHKGVSSARNIGLKLAKGKYVNFLDPDDIWDSKAFRYILLFLKIYPNVNIIAGRMKFFEASQNYHPLDYKFYKTRVVNLTEEYNCIHQSASSTFFRSSLIKGKYFEEGVFSGEDTRYVNNFLLLNPIMGLVKEAIYYYRRRADSSSTVQSQKNNKEFYFKTLNDVEYYLINKSISLYNKTIPFIKFFVGYDVLYRIKSNANKLLDEKAFKEYCIIIEDLLNKIEDKYILEQKNLNNNYKLLALSKKYKKDLRHNLVIVNNYLFYLNYTMLDFRNNKNIIIWRILEMKNNILHLEGKDNLWIPREKYYYYCKLGNKIFYPKYIEYPNFDVITMYGINQKGRILIFDIPFEKDIDNQTFKFYISFKNYNEEIYTSLGWYSHIPPLDNGYYMNENSIIKYIQNRLTIYKYNINLLNIYESLYCLELSKRQKENLIFLRKYFKKRKETNIKRKKEIWIINDRRNQAGDNGEYFFRYLKQKNIENIDIYFAIEKNCTDYKRLKLIGDILDLNSKRYLYVFVISDKIISSISNSWVSNPFGNDYKYMRDILNFEVIFLQHGIIKDDLSKFLSRYNKKYDYFITSSKKEYKSISDPKYGYYKNEVILTGLPRYDNLHKLKDNKIKKRMIIIIPTWRMYIKGTKDLITYESIHSDTFIYTDYFKFYNDLINDKKLLFQMTKYNYTGIFCLHPCFSAQWLDFNENNIFSVLDKCDYQKLLLESSLLITDYSSIFFDFAYLRKPIIYSHFDYEEYRDNHYQKGYFDYRTDGFGPICKDINCTVDEIIYEIKINCILTKKYLRRIKKFFTFSDDNNSKRIFDIIRTNGEKEIKFSKYPLLIIFFIILLSFLLKFKIYM